MNTIKFKLFLVFSFIILLGGYFLYQARSFLIGPQINIDEPKEAQVVSRSYLKVIGQALNISNLSMNGRQIFTDEKGNFEEGLLLARGYNIIEITASDKFGRIKKEHRDVIFE